MNFSNKSVLRNLHGHEVRHERVFHFLKIAVLLLIQAGEMQFKANEATFRGWSINCVSQRTMGNLRCKYPMQIQLLVKIRRKPKADAVMGCNWNL